MIRLYVIDDHYLIIEGLYSTFDLESDNFKVVGGSLDVDDAINRISSDQVDIIILDLFIRQANPVNNLQKIQQAFPGIPVVILTQEDSLLWRVEMMRYGARAYVCKTEDKSVLKRKLQLVADGEVVMNTEVANALVSYCDSNFHNQLIADYKEIMTCLAAGMNIKEVAKKFGQSESSIEKKLKALKIIFNAKTNIELVCKSLFRKISHTVH